MKARQKLPDLPENALRNHGTDEAVDRIWQRLDGDLQLKRPRSRAVALWAPAALAIVFGLGMFVGARWFSVTAPLATPVTPEPILESNESLPSQAPFQAAGEEPKVDHSEAPVKRAPTSVQLGAAGAPATTPEILLSPPAPTTLLVPVVPQWETLASNSKYAQAWDALGRESGFDSMMAGASADQLWTLRDIAKQVKQSGRAMAALRAIVDRFPSDPGASLAAWTLSQALEKSDPAGAAYYLAKYRALSPKGDFAEDALVQQIKAASAQGNVELAKKLSEQYEKDFPNGRRSDEVRTLLGKSKPDSGTKKAAAHPEEGPVDDEEEAPAPPPAGKAAAPKTPPAP